jgi:hypothetical protein
VNSTLACALDCAKLSHWKTQQDFEEMFEFRRDYMAWVCLRLEDRGSIGLFENEWNDLDKFTAATRMLHTTRRMTQPWKTGLPVDWRPAEHFRRFPPLGWLMRARRQLFGEYAFLGHYKVHPDPNQEHFFFGLLKECRPASSRRVLREQMHLNHVRHDAFEVLARTPDLPPAPLHPLSQAIGQAA